MQVSAFLEFGATSTRTAVVDADGDITLLSLILLKDGTASVYANAPRVLHLLVARTSVLIHHHRVFLRGIKTCRFDHPAIEYDTLGGGKGEEFLATHVERGIGVGQSLVVFQNGDGSGRRTTRHTTKGYLCRRIQVAPGMDETFEIV